MTDAPRPNLPEFSVTELSAALKRTVEDAYPYVRVRGEVTGFRGVHASGHAYFALKDAGARIEAVVWKGTYGRLRFKPEEGLEVVATGKLTTYPGSSKYQIVIESIEPAGAGALMALLEQRKAMLAKEGLFDAARKQLLPFLPAVIGVITSPTGAVIRDILHRLADRFPRRVIVWPVRVQGETSAAEVAAAIAGFNALPPGGPIPRPDLLIVARGGGSLEDLWSFNEEIVVRAAAGSDIPLIAAVGHETDTTLIDYAADVRAPTPTGAAEIAVPVRAELLAQVADRGGRLTGALVRLVQRRRDLLRAAARALPRADVLLAGPRQRLDAAEARLPRALTANTHLHRAALLRVAGRLVPQALSWRLDRETSRIDALAQRLALARVTQMRAARERIAHDRQRAEALGARLAPAFARALAGRRERLEGRAALLDALSYHAVLARGFALVRDASGRAVRAAAAVKPGDRLEIQFADGRTPVVAGGVAPRPARRRGGPDQGSLFE
ncbi:exodeoxyribonuclease VII large subunit [Blastochloris tepida]|uniref:Exodeoxyribonuclease 7 large subunit n=1 Tax=Blastochloris tepida TaxID=2233851 RepID=A0A348G291_9HYPH|nr:exodeoxyribonuclease VII large subunit [Blastochloris tepida]BBF93674.1 exodeoxyribonuclease 7 large subunit [Blastochloris tepida]